MYQGNPRELDSYIIEYKGMYPRISIILDNWEDVELLNDLFKFGFIDTIYIEPSDDLAKLKYFPEAVVNGVKSYIKGVKPQKTNFAKIYFASPDLESEAVFFIKIGSINSDNTEVQEMSQKEKDVPVINQEWISRRRALGFHVLLMMMKEEYHRSRFWSYAMTENAIVICRKDKDTGQTTSDFSKS